MEKLTNILIRIASIIMLTVGIIIFVIGSAVQFGKYKIKETGIPVQAEVVKVSKHYYDSNKRSYYDAYITYECEGKEYSEVKLGYFDSTIYRGKKFTIYCIPDHPKYFITERTSDYYLIILIILGAILTVAGAIIMLVMRVRDTKRKNFLSNGRTISATVSYIEQDVYRDIDYYIIHCCYKDNYSNTIYYYESNKLLNDPSEKYPIGSRVEVIVDPNDYNKYIMDVE